jgi:acyl-CoA hydrolase
VALGSLDFPDVIRPGDQVMWGQAAAEPAVLIDALLRQRADIGAFRIFVGTSWCRSLTSDIADLVHIRSYCGAGLNRKLAQAGVLDIVPCRYSHLPGLIRRGVLQADVLLLQVSPPDAAGRYSLSMAHDYLPAALDAARIVIAEVNQQAPWTYGERYIHESEIDIAIETDRELPDPMTAGPSPVELAIAKRAAGLIEDGATLQVGIGTLPAAILSQLGGHRELGLHTGALIDEAAALVAAGVITNARKSIDAGVCIAGVVMGGRRAQALGGGNPSVQFRSIEYTHAADVLARLDNLVAINSAIEVDLTGQVNAEVGGGTYVGAVGGALDFLEGANRSRGGLPIIALPSTVGAGANTKTRVVSRLSGPVSTARSNVGIVITEHGAVDLRGLSIHERIPKMISLAAPEFREQLARDAFDIGVRRLRPPSELPLFSKPGIFALDAIFSNGDRNA